MEVRKEDQLELVSFNEKLPIFYVIVAVVLVFSMIDSLRFRLFYQLNMEFLSPLWLCVFIQ